MGKTKHLRFFYCSVLIYLIYYHLFWSLNSLTQVFFLKNNNEIIHYSLNIICLFGTAYLAYKLFRKFILNNKLNSLYLLIFLILTKVLLFFSNYYLGKMMFEAETETVRSLIGLNQILDTVWLVFNVLLILVLFFITRKRSEELD